MSNKTRVSDYEINHNPNIISNANKTLQKNEIMELNALLKQAKNSIINKLSRTKVDE